MSLRRILLCLATWLTLGAVGRGESMRVGIETNAEPMSFLQPDGKTAGFSVDMINAIAAEMKFVAVPVIGMWPDLFEQFKAGKVDVLVSLAHTNEREEFIDFAVTHLVMQGTLFVRRGDHSIRSLDDLRSRRLAVQLNSYSHNYVREHQWDQQLIWVPTFREAMRALDEGRCDAVTAIDIIGNAMIQHDHLKNVEASELNLPGYSFELHMGVHAGDAKRLAVLNEGLARIRANGTYDKLHEKWIGPLQARRLRFKDVEAYLLPLAGLLAAVIVVIVLQRRLLSQVRQHAAALRESEERLTLVLEGSDDGFWDWDLKANRFTRSERWANMLGYTPEEIQPTIEGGASLVHPDDRQEYDAWQNRLNSGATDSYKVEYRMKAKSGEWRWILDRGKVVARAPDGTPLRMAGTHTDITERKLTERALLENRELLARSAHLLEQTQAVAHIGGWEFDLRTNQLFWSDETYRIHETTPAEYQPTVSTAIEFYAPESRAIISAAVDQAITHGTPYDIEVSLITAKRRIIRVRSTGRAERRDGQVAKIYGAFQDITAEKRAEEEQRKIHLKMLETQKLESLGVLAGGIAHDFNNLLTVILANASFARQSRPADEHLAPIEVAARRAADLCRQMLAYAGHGNLIVERLDLGRLVHDTARLLEVSISKKAALHVSLADNLPAVEGDASQLRQVVMNLVINASEALGEAPGEIRVTTRVGRPNAEPADAVHAFDAPDGDCVCLEVSDTGAGMSPATLARVFDPFFTTKFTGRGLGLAATLGIVRTHHGALTVQSSVGRGSTFRLFLPAAAPTPETVATPIATTPAPARTPTLLVVDDEPSVLGTADALLRHQGYATVLASDGIAAVRAFKAEPDRFAAIMLDLTMPGLDGAEVLREIRALRPAARVLVMSGFSEADVLHRLRGLGQVTLLNKPFTLELMLRKLREVLAT